MYCQQILPLLSAYIDDELEPAEKALVEKHLPICPDCAKRLQELRKVSEITRSLGEVSPPTAFSQRLRQAVREEVDRLSSPYPVEKRVSWWQRITPRAALGLASAAAGVLILILFLNTLPQKTTTLKTGAPPVTERAAPQYAEPLGKSAEMDELAGRPKPQVRATENDYTAKDVQKKFQKLPVWKDFGRAYTVKDVQRFQAVVTRYITERVRPQGKNALSMIKSLSVVLPPPDADFVALPSYLERAKFNHKRVWIVVLNWQKKSGDESPLERGRVYVVNFENQEILFSSIF